MATFCGTRYLEKQLQSLVRQTRLPYELIVCDDQSSDDTVQLLERFRAEAPFIVRVVVNEKNIGATRNFDRAMRLAVGEYIALCDQDDIWLPDKLKTVVEHLEANPEAGGVFSDALLIGEDGRPIRGGVSGATTLWKLHRFSTRKQNAFRDGNACRVLLRHTIVTGATLVVRRELRLLWQPMPESWVHDAWMAWMLVLYSRLDALPEPLIAYRLHSEQQLGVSRQKQLIVTGQHVETERERCRRVAAQIDELCQYVEQHPCAIAGLQNRLQRKAEFMRMRSELSTNVLFRGMQIACSSLLYRRYARGIRSQMKDVFLT